MKQDIRKRKRPNQMVWIQILCLWDYRPTRPVHVPKINSSQEFKPQKWRCFEVWMTQIRHFDYENSVISLCHCVAFWDSIKASAFCSVKKETLDSVICMLPSSHLRVPYVLFSTDTSFQQNCLYSPILVPAWHAGEKTFKLLSRPI